MKLIFRSYLVKLIGGVFGKSWLIFEGVDWKSYSGEMIRGII